MPTYVVSNSDETKQALDPDGGNVKVGFNKTETSEARDKSRIRRVIIIALVVIGCVVVFLLCAWFVYAVFIKSTPQWQSDNFLLETIPGLRHRPKEEQYGTLIALTASNNQGYKKWTDVMEDFLAVYRKPNLIPGRSQNIFNCDYDRPPVENQVCDVDVKNWFPCVQENNFNYHRSAPCVFITLNKHYDWRPEFYNDTKYLPEEMPRNLKQHILSQNAVNSQLLNTIWINCEGENPADVENMGPVQYIPRHGFPGYLYIYKNAEGYLSPVMAIYFERPRTGVLINIECRIWAPNIEYNREKGQGLVHFELLVE